jgi:hypothetical protein
MHRGLDRGPTPSRRTRLNDANFRFLGGEPGGTAEVGDAIRVEQEALRQRSGAGPLQCDRRRIEGMHRHAVAGDQVALEADIGADAEGVDHGVGAEGFGDETASGLPDLRAAPSQPPPPRGGRRRVQGRT